MGTINVLSDAEKSHFVQAVKNMPSMVSAELSYKPAKDLAVTGG